MKSNFNWNNNLTQFHEVVAYNGNHYIDKASRNYALSQINFNTKNPIILEIGSSSGYLLCDLKQISDNIIGTDCCISESLKTVSLENNVSLFRSDILFSPIKDNSIDIIIILNVLEHIKNDNKALQEIYRIIKPKGTVIIEVPANPKLYDSYDKYLKHYRRYTSKEIKSKSVSSGFKIERSSHMGFLLFLPFVFSKKFKPINKQIDIRKRISFGGTTINSLFDKIMRIELMIGKYIKYPFGIRCLITLVK